MHELQILIPLHFKINFFLGINNNVGRLFNHVHEYNKFIHKKKKKKRKKKYNKQLIINGQSQPSQIGLMLCDLSLALRN